MEFNQITRRQFGISTILPASWELDTARHLLCDDKKTPCEIFFSEDSTSDVTFGFSVKSLEQCYQKALDPMRDESLVTKKRLMKHFPIKHSRQSDRFMVEYKILYKDHASQGIRAHVKHYVQYYYWNKNLRKVVFAKFCTASRTQEKAYLDLFDKMARSIRLI